MALVNKRSRPDHHSRLSLHQACQVPQKYPSGYMHNLSALRHW